MSVKIQKYKSGIYSLKVKQVINQYKPQLEYIKNLKELKEILITGGDAFINRQKLIPLIDYLINNPDYKHIKFIRLATRTPLSAPDLFASYSGDLYKLQKQAKEEGKLIEIATQFNHPDEFDKEVEEA